MKLNVRHLMTLTATLSLTLLTGCGGGSVNSADLGTAGGAMGAPALEAITPIEAPVPDANSAPAEPSVPADASKQEVAMGNQTEEAPEAEASPAEPPAETPASATPAPEASASALPTLPANTEVQEPYNPNTAAAATGMTATGNFKVDRDMLNEWQAVGVVSDGSSVYVTAVDRKTLTKGTVIRMDASSGESWKNLGRSTLKSILTLGFGGYALSKNVQGVALDSSNNLFVNDSTQYLYQLTAPKYTIKKVKSGLSGALDLAVSNGTVYVATSSGIQKYDSSLSGGVSFGTVTVSGGIATDAQGNVYVVSGTTIQKLDATGNATQVVSGLTSPVDVTVAQNGKIYVLESDAVKEFDNGTLKATFGSGEFKSAKAVCTDTNGAVYVADMGTSHKDSQIIKYEAGNASLATAISTIDSADVAE